MAKQKISTTAKALQAGFGTMRRSRVALETGMHPAWVSQLLRELGHEVIMEIAPNVRLIASEPEEGR